MQLPHFVLSVVPHFTGIYHRSQVLNRAVRGVEEPPGRFFSLRSWGQNSSCFHTLKPGALVHIMLRPRIERLEGVWLDGRVVLDLRKMVLALKRVVFRSPKLSLLDFSALGVTSGVEIDVETQLWVVVDRKEGDSFGLVVVALSCFRLHHACSYLGWLLQ